MQTLAPLGERGQNGDLTQLSDPGPAAARAHGAAWTGLRFEIVRRADLPSMAWALRHESGDDRVQVYAGADVREDADVFWEGVNPCADAPATVIDHHFPLATGAALRGQELVVFTPGHTLDRVFVIRCNGALYASNSLPFVLRASGTQLDPRCLNYHWTLGAVRSFRQYAPLLGGELAIYHTCNVLIDKNNSVRWEPRPLPPDFTTYGEYRAQLDAYIDGIAAATAHPANGRYTPISTISTGYDSPAATILSRRIGADTALTIRDSRAGNADSGEEIAAILGFKVEACARSDYQAAGLEAERLFYFSGIANDVIFYPWRETLRSRLLFTGFKGDEMWDRTLLRPISHWSWDGDGATMIEMRLRANFVHLPPAYFGAARADRLLAISQSEDMAPWTLWNAYDRPIARRLGEEAGVPRDLFGQSKKMVTSTIGVDGDRFITLDDLGLSREFRSLLSAHRQEYAGAALSAGFAANNGAHKFMRFAHGAAHGAKRVLSRAKRGKAPSAAPNRKRRPSMADRFLFELEFQLPARRQFMTPFTDLNFAAQVSNALLRNDYQGF